MEFLSTAAEFAGIYFTTGVRWLFLILSIFILARQIRSLLQAKNPSEIWAYLGCPDGSSVPLTHWENLIGRSRGCDVILNLENVSRSHGTLVRDSAGVWKYNDLNSKNGSSINGFSVDEPTVLKAGDVLTIAGSDFTLYPVSLEERMENIEKRKRRTHPVSPWPSLAALTIFQVLMVIQFGVSLKDEFPPQLPLAVGLLCALMWVYVIVMRMFKRVGFEMEIIAFYLSTLSLAVTASAYPGTVFKQALCITLGVALFFGLCWFLRDLNRAKKITYILIGISVILLLANLVLGTSKFGAQNWITIGGFSIQPSELVKIVFIYVGAATLDELQQRKNLTVFMLFSLFCLGCLALMGDFGTAMIFFVTFLVISFLRSGDFSKLILIVGAAGVMGMMVLRFKPYIASRFDTWGHVWDDPTGGGFQQVQTMTASASGGLPGLGAGEGNFSDVAAASTDLVFGLLSEEWGLITAILAVLCIITLGVFAVRSIIAGRSTYYSIAACAATSMFIFQTILNVFGSIDLLPLTGVTFPLVSSGGTSMIASWGLLSFLKAADTRQNASFAIRLDKKGEFDNEMEGGEFENPEEIFEAVDSAPAYESSRRTRHNILRGRGRSDMEQRPREAYEDYNEDYNIKENKSRKNAPNINYSHNNEDTTLLKNSGVGFRRQIKYKDISDEDFFNNLENIRPEESFAEKWEKVSPGKEKSAKAARTAGTADASGSGSAVKTNSNKTKSTAQSPSAKRPAQNSGRNRVSGKPTGRQSSNSGGQTSNAGGRAPSAGNQTPAASRTHGTNAQRSTNAGGRTTSAGNRANPQRIKPSTQPRGGRKDLTEERDSKLTLEDIFGDYKK